MINVDKDNDDDYDGEEDDDDNNNIIVASYLCIPTKRRQFRGDVKLAEIDGPIVKLELVGACGTCPRSICVLISTNAV